MKIRLSALLAMAPVTLFVATVAAREPNVLDLTNGNTEQSISLDIQAQKGKYTPFSVPEWMKVFGIDDKPLKEQSALGKVFLPIEGVRVDEVKLPPGKHRILLYAKGKIGCGWAYQWFVAEPGKRYAAKFEFDRLNYRVWIEDSASGTPVGGRVGSSDEPEPTELAPAIEEARQRNVPCNTIIINT